MFLRKGDFRRPTTGSLSRWEQIKHSGPGIPKNVNERTMCLAEKGNSWLKDIVRGFENMMYAFLAIQ